MAFSFANVAAGLGTAGPEGVKIHDGPELAEIQTDQLGFTGVNGEVKLRLLPEPWPLDALPPPSASLLSVASSQKLVAAASPNALIITTTDAVRDALKGESKDNISTLDPLLAIPHARLAHVAFSADESVLVVSEQERGGLVVYQVDRLKTKQAQPALQLATNNTGLSALTPNPAVQSAHLFACVTISGDLLLADLSTGQLIEGSQGPVLATNVTSLSWSNKGKQLVVGQRDGTAVQIKPDGSIAARLPKSTSIPDGVPLSGISWLENDLFFAIYTPDSLDTTEGIPSSEYYIITRDKTQYEFQKLPEILPPFGVERVPTHHFITRLRDWKPYVNDLVLLSSTTATEIGMLTKANQALSTSDPVIDAFTFTSVDDDTRRAALPLSGASETSPIGMALDLSAEAGVVNPIPSDPEIEETAGPVPNILILNHEGILCSWWIVYNDSVRQRTTFSGFATLNTMNEARAAASPPTNSISQTQGITSSSPPFQPLSQPTNPGPTLPQHNTIDASPFAKSLATFGQSPSHSSFGAGTGLRSISKIGGDKTSWTSTGFTNSGPPASGESSTFGQPAFGQSTFGQSSALQSNSHSSLFAAQNNTSQQSSAFGQTSTPSAPAFGKSGFGSTTAFGSGSTSSFLSNASSAEKSGFSAFASTRGFTNKTADDNGNVSASPFGQAAGTPFGLNAGFQSPFQKASASSTFGQTTSDSPFVKGSPFGAAGLPGVKTGLGPTTLFKLDSAFKGDGSAKDDLPKPADGAGLAFGASFGDLLSSSAPTALSPTHDKEEDMADESTEESLPNINEGRQSQGQPQPPSTLVTPPSTIFQSKATPPQHVSNLFNTEQQDLQTPKPPNGDALWSFANTASTTPKETPSVARLPFSAPDVNTQDDTSTQPAVSTPKVEHGPRITTESPSDDDAVNIKHVSEPPLPPDSVSKPDYQAGDTSMSSIISNKPGEPPLPSEFLPANRSATSQAATPALQSDGEDEHDPEDDEFSTDLDGSGEDVTEDISPADEGDVEDEDEEEHDNEPSSPESSFKDDNTTNSMTSPTGGLFTNISNQQTKPSRPLFGEIGAAPPIFAPPKPQESPRSPSPVRQLLPHDTLRSESRSVSAPVRARSAIDQRKLDYAQSNIAAEAAQTRQEETAREKARLDAALRAQEQARADQLQSLQDDEDVRVQRELAQPIEPTSSLDSFITYEPASRTDPAKADIPAQIERLYQDINSMVYTLGINARSLASFVMYQRDRSPNETWPEVLSSDTPLDALNDEWFLQDIDRLHLGVTALSDAVGSATIRDVARTLASCQDLLARDLGDLRNKVVALRKSRNARSRGDSATAPLSAEQSSIQQDLRKSASTVQTQLVTVEDSLSILRARLSGIETSSVGGSRPSVKGNAPKRPTVEAVVNTVAKMTSMAEKRSADVDVLEGQLKRLGFTVAKSPSASQVLEPSTPPRSHKTVPRTPGSDGSSVFYTPKPGVSGSARSLRALASSTKTINGFIAIPLEDQQLWRQKENRKREMASALRNVLSQKQPTSVAI